MLYDLFFPIKSEDDVKQNVLAKNTQMFHYFVCIVCYIV